MITLGDIILDGIYLLFVLWLFHTFLNLLFPNSPIARYLNTKVFGDEEDQDSD